jgi:hypothetical protein
MTTSFQERRPAKAASLSLPSVDWGVRIIAGKEINMATDPEYHTILPEYGPREVDVYHNHNDCSEGKKIKQEHRTAGKGTGRRLCDVCAGLA